jgi:hypothetical protein
MLIETNVFFLFQPAKYDLDTAKDLFEKDGPYLSDFIFQNTHFFTYDLLPSHTLKKSYPGFLC